MGYLSDKQINTASQWWKSVKQIPWNPVSFPQLFHWVAWGFLIVSLIIPVIGFLDVSLIALGFSVYYNQVPCRWDELKFGYWFALSLTIFGQLYLLFGVLRSYLKRLNPEKI